MNKDNAKDYLPLVQALAEGKAIQYRNAGKEEWRDTSNPKFKMGPEHYRIKPEPREIWVNIYPIGEKGTVFTHTAHYGYDSEEEAREAAGNAALEVAVLMRTVFDE